MKKFVISCVLSLTLMLAVGGTGALAVGGSIDSINSNGNSSSSQQSNSNSNNNSSASSEEYPVDKNESVSSYFKSYRPVTDENMKSANKLGSPIVVIFGNLIGFILIITSAGIFVVTALDLAYIGLPIVRPLLAPQASGGGMSGGMGGMGGYGGMSGGMGMGGGGSAPQGKQWVSDEALKCVQMASGGQQGGGMSMGGMGMGGMGMGMQGGGAQQTDTKSVIFTYFKKRMFFLIVFGLASVMLTSSVFLDCGINVAQLGFKVVASLNSAIQGIF